MISNALQYNLDSEIRRMYSFIKEGHHILVLWDVSVPAESLQSTVKQLQNATGKSGKVSLENAERLVMASFPASSYDIVLSGVMYPQSIVHSIELLGEIVRIVKPQGDVVLQEAVIATANSQQLRTTEKLASILKITGLTDLSDVKPIHLNDSECEGLKGILNTSENISVVEFHCKKPNFEVGSSAKLSFAKKVGLVTPSAEVASVWKLDDTIDNDIETIDSDTLLDENDLQKPDPSTLRVCGTTGKRKACKNCSCGLAQELEAEAASKAPQIKTSACGNCYLGDAFRCATCPYLGMPAFKPGEKIQLSANQLKADV